MQNDALIALLGQPVLYIAPMDGQAYQDAINALGISQEMSGALLGVEGRTVRRWVADQTRVAETARALLWAMRHHDPRLVLALRDGFQPAERKLPETTDRLLWALARDPTLAHALSAEWVPADGATTPLMEGMLLAVADVPSRVALLRGAERPAVPRSGERPAMAGLRDRQRERRDLLLDRSTKRRAGRLEREAAAYASDPSPIERLSGTTYQAAMGFMREWVAGDEELPEGDPAWGDIHAALRGTHEPGISMAGWVRKAAAYLVALGYEEVGDM